MILVHPELHMQLDMHYYCAAEWIIESPDLFSKYLEELESQIAGECGSFVLSDDDKEIVLAKNAEIIVNPLFIDINDKKIISKIYSELVQIANNEEMYLKTQEILSTLQNYFLEVESQYSNTLITDESIDLAGLFKIMGVKVEYDSLNYFERLIQYIKLQNDVLKKNFIILVNTRSYFSYEKINQLLQFMNYNEINLLLIESFQRDFTDQTRKYIIDSDGCEI